MQMADGLPSRGAVVYADVVSGRTKLELKLLLRRFNRKRGLTTLLMV